MSTLTHGRRALIAVLLAAVLTLGAGAILPLQAQDTTTANPPVTTDATETLFSQIYNQVSPSVVAISVSKDVSQTTPLGQQSGVERGLGSGFVIDNAGYIVTNDHVVDGANSIEVAFVDGTLARARVIGLDPDSDIAVLQVEDVPADILQPVNFGDSDNLFIGESVLAIGSPFGERWTLTSGIVSGVDRVISALSNFSIGGVIQTDASINPGNSGGPLLNLDGQVVGVNAQIASSSGSNSGVGFAIPANLVERVAHQLIDKGYVEYSYLGISGGDLSLDAIEQLSLPSDTRGVLVGEATAGGPAARAGLNSAEFNGDGADQMLKSADVITAINGQPLLGMADLISYLASDTQPGDKVTLTVLRGGDQMSIDVTLTPRPAQPANS
ncbi:MAG: trypsin-like peptidase domain-containing protein [Anaerolineae bacterium]|nr:trypsin-like peptidase domain-containing protein [Anaerolineae bacterium]